jgi:hypothetical protein
MKNERVRQRYTQISVSVAQGIFLLSPERLSRSTLHLKEGDREVWDSCTL